MHKQAMRSEIIVGMVVCRDVMSDDGALILPKDSAITTSALKKLDAYGIDKITIQVEVIQAITRETDGMPVTTIDSEEYNEFLSYYNNQVNDVTNNLNAIMGGRIVDMNEIQQLLDSLVQRKPNNPRFWGLCIS